MGHLDVSRVSYALPDGTPLLDDVSFRVPASGVVALVGANGAGKSTLLRLIASEIPLQTGTVTTSGTIGVMPQFIGSVRDKSVVRDLLLAAAPQRLRDAAAAVDAAELALMEADDEPLQMRYAQALADWADAGGYDLEVLWDTVTVAALHESYEPGEVAGRRVALRRGAETPCAGGTSAGSGQRAATRRAGQLPRRTRQDMAGRRSARVAQDGAVHLPRPRVACAGRDRRGHGRAWRRREHGLDAPGWLRHLPRHPSRAVRTARRASTTMGRRAREAQGAGTDVQDEGGLQRRARESIPGGADASEEVRGCRASRSHGAKAARHDALDGRPHWKTCGRVSGSGAHRADGPIRCGDLVWRAGGGSGRERQWQVTFLEVVGRGGHRSGARAPTGPRCRY